MPTLGSEKRLRGGGVSAVKTGTAAGDCARAVFVGTVKECLKVWHGLVGFWEHTPFATRHVEKARLFNETVTQRALSAKEPLSAVRDSSESERRQGELMRGSAIAA